MLYKKPTRREALAHHRGLRLLAEFVAGLHAGHGIAHGITPPRRSRARRSHPG